MKSRIFVLLSILLSSVMLNANERTSEKIEKFSQLQDKLLMIEILNNDLSPEGYEQKTWVQSAFLISNSGVAVSYVGDRMPDSILNILATYKGVGEPILPLLAFNGFIVFKLRFVKQTPYFELADMMPENDQIIYHLGLKNNKICSSQGKSKTQKYKDKVTKYFSGAEITDNCMGSAVVNKAGKIIGASTTDSTNSKQGEFVPVSELHDLLSRRFKNFTVNGTLALGEKISILGYLLDFGLKDFNNSWVETYVNDKKISTSKFDSQSGILKTNFTLEIQDQANDSKDKVNKNIPVLVKLENNKQVEGIYQAKTVKFSSAGSEVNFPADEIINITIEHVGGLTEPQDEVETKNDGNLLLTLDFGNFELNSAGKLLKFQRKEVKKIIFGKKNLNCKFMLCWQNKKGQKFTFPLEEFAKDTTKKKYQWHLPTPAIKPKGKNLVKNPGFEDVDKKGYLKFWQKQDDVCSIRVKIDSGPTGKETHVLKCNTKVLLTEYFKRQEQMKLENPPPPFKPSPVPDKKKYATVGASYGVSFYSDPIKIEKGNSYLLEIDEFGFGRANFQPKIFVKGYSKVQVKDEIRERIHYKMYMPCRNSSGKWEHFTQLFSPTYKTPKVDYIRIMIFPYWPNGIYMFDNVSVRIVGNHHIYNKYIHDDKSVPMK